MDRHESEHIEYAPFEVEEHLSGVLALCEAAGWESFRQSSDLARRSLTAPGVCTMVALRGRDVIGFAQMQGDGVLQAHLSLIAVAEGFRREGVGRRLVEEAALRCGARRVDLISSRESEAFYESFAHRSRAGFRIYPSSEEGEAG